MVTGSSSTALPSSAWNRKNVVIAVVGVLLLAGVGLGVARSATAAEGECVPGALVAVPVVAMNVGGPAVSAGGKDWTADANGTGGHVWTTTSTADIANTDLDAVYRSERAAKNLTYNIPVDNGTYVVRLHVAEMYWGAPGGGPASRKRVETFNIEGGFPEARGISPAQDAKGPMKALVLSYEATVTDGKLTVQGFGHTDFAALQGIEASRLAQCAENGTVAQPTVMPQQPSTPTTTEPDTGTEAEPTTEPEPSTEPQPEPTAEPEPTAAPEPEQAAPPAGGTTGYNAAVLADNPAAFFAMSTPGQNEADLAGKGPGGTYQGGAGSTKLPNGDTAAVFNGQGQYLSVPSRASFSIPTTGKMTWEAWIKPSTLQYSSDYVNWMGKCDKNGGANCEWQARMYSTNNGQGRCNRLSAYVFNPGGGLGSGADWQPDCGLISQPQWLHVVGEYDLTNTPAGCSASQPGGINIWVNGVKWDQSSHGDTGCMSQYGITPRAGNSAFTIGRVNGETHFPGAIGKVAIYNHLLSDSQIKNHFQAMTGQGAAGSCGDTCRGTLVK